MAIGKMRDLGPEYTSEVDTLGRLDSYASVLSYSCLACWDWLWFLARGKILRHIGDARIAAPFGRALARAPREGS